MALTLAASLLAAAPANAQTPPLHTIGVGVEEVDGQWRVVYTQTTFDPVKDRVMTWSYPLLDRDGNEMSAADYDEPGFVYSDAPGLPRHIPVYPGDWTMVPITRCANNGETIDCTNPAGFAPSTVDVTIVRYECAGPVAPDSQQQPEGWVSIECNRERLAGLRAEEARLAREKARQDAEALAAQREGDRLNCEGNRAWLREMNARNEELPQISASGSCAAVEQRVIDYSLLTHSYTVNGVPISDLTDAERDAAVARHREQHEESEGYTPYKDMPYCQIGNGRGSRQIRGGPNAEASCHEQGGDWFPGGTGQP